MSAGTHACAHGCGRARAQSRNSTATASKCEGASDSAKSVAEGGVTNEDRQVLRVEVRRLHRGTTVDREDLTGDEPGQMRQEEEHRPGDVVWSAPPAERDGVAVG